MKILFSRFDSALHFITLGWRNVLVRLGHECVVWKPEDKPAFDIFDEFEPDIFIGTTYELSDALIKCIKARPELKVVLKANNWGPVDEEIDRDEYPIGISDEDEQNKIKELKEECGRPDLLFNFYHANRMEETMGYWKSKGGLDIIDMQPAADIYTYFPTLGNENLKCDIGFVGGYWGYKARNLDKYFLPLCYPVGKYNIKIIGNKHWPVPQYIGSANDDVCNDLFSSALICPNVSEPHANVWGWEVNERPFKLSACKAFCITDPMSSLSEDTFPNGEMVISDGPEHFIDLIHQFIINPDLRQPNIDSCFDVVMQQDTYHHRIKNLLSRLGLEQNVECEALLSKRLEHEVYKELENVNGK